MTDKKTTPGDWPDADVRMPDKNDKFTDSMTEKQLRLYLSAPELLAALENLLAYSQSGSFLSHDPEGDAIKVIRFAKGETE